MIYYFIIFIWLILQIIISVWMLKAKPNEDFYKKLPKRIIILSQLAFYSGWKKEIQDINDLSVMEKYHKRLSLWLFSILLFLNLSKLYAFQAIIDLKNGLNF